MVTWDFPCGGLSPPLGRIPASLREGIITPHSPVVSDQLERYGMGIITPLAPWLPWKLETGILCQVLFISGALHLIPHIPQHLFCVLNGLGTLMTT